MRCSTVSSTIAWRYRSACDFRETTREATLRKIDDREETSCFLYRRSKFEPGFTKPVRIFEQQIDNGSRVPRYQKRANGGRVEDPVRHGSQLCDPLFSRHRG